MPGIHPEFISSRADGSFAGFVQRALPSAAGQAEFGRPGHVRPDASISPGDLIDVAVRDLPQLDVARRDCPPPDRQPR